jgi:Gpi16 subunit, GPI transamidase component
LRSASRCFTLVLSLEPLVWFFSLWWLPRNLPYDESRDVISARWFDFLFFPGQCMTCFATSTLTTFITRSQSTTQNEDGSIDILYLETMPWIVQLYLHTLVPKINGVVTRELSPFSVCRCSCADAGVANAISNIVYTPSIPHGKPTMFQGVYLVLSCPPCSFVPLLPLSFVPSAAARLPTFLPSSSIPPTSQSANTKTKC